MLRLNELRKNCALNLWAKDMDSAMIDGPDNALADSLLQMVNNREFSDVILVCQDGVQFHASRMLLAARSLFFKQLLLDGMSDGSKPRRTSFELPTVTSSVLAIILKFLYAEVLRDDDIRNSKSFCSRYGCKYDLVTCCTGEDVCDDREEGFHFRLDWEFLLKVVIAARFLMIERLENVIIERLWDDVRKVDSGSDYEHEHELRAVACSLSTLCEYDTLWNPGKVKLTDGVVCSEPTYVKSFEGICFQLLQMLVFYELEASTLYNLTKKAFQFCLSKRRRTSSDDIWDWDIEEYLKLREIFTWGAVQAAESEADVVILDRTCLPGPEDALKFLQACDSSSHSSDGTMYDFSKGRESFARRIVKDDVKQFLPMVELVSIHPELLVNIIEPLGLIDPQELSKIYSLQAMRVSKKLRHQVPHVWTWVGSGLYSLRTPINVNYSMTFTVSVDTSSKEKICMLAAADLQMQFPRNYVWEIMVTPHGLLEFEYLNILEIGFYRVRPGENFRQMVQKAPSTDDRLGWRSSDDRRDLSLSGDRRGSALKITCEEDFYDRRRFKGSSGHVPGSPRTLWNRPLKVTLNRKDGVGSFSSAGPGRHASTFPVDNAEDEVFYPAVYVQANDSKHVSWHGSDSDGYRSHYYTSGSTLRPHYDRLTVKIQCLEGFDESVCVKLADSWT